FMFCFSSWCPPVFMLFTYTTLFRSVKTLDGLVHQVVGDQRTFREPAVKAHVEMCQILLDIAQLLVENVLQQAAKCFCAEQLAARSEEHTSELQSRFDIVCRLLLEKQ